MDWKACKIFWASWSLQWLWLCFEGKWCSTESLMKEIKTILTHTHHCARFQFQFSQLNNLRKTMHQRFRLQQKYDTPVLQVYTSFLEAWFWNVGPFLTEEQHCFSHWHKLILYRHRSNSSLYWWSAVILTCIRAAYLSDWWIRAWAAHVQLSNKLS